MSFSTFPNANHNNKEEEDELSSILTDIRLYDRKQQKKLRRDPDERLSQLSDQMIPQDRSQDQQGPSLFEELVKFQRQNSINGADDDVASVISTQLSAQTSSDESFDCGDTINSSYFTVRGPSAPTLFMNSPQHQRLERAFTSSPTSFGARLRSSPRKQGVYRQPLSRGYFLNKHGEEGPNRSASFAFASPSPFLPSSPRRASLPNLRRPETKDVEEFAELLHANEGLAIVGDEALARRLQLLEVSAASGEKDLAPTFPPGTEAASAHPTIAAVDTVARGIKPQSLDFNTVTRSGNVDVELSLDQDHEDLEMAIFVSKQEQFALNPEQGYNDNHSPITMKCKDPQDDINCSYDTAANSSFCSYGDDREQFLQKGLLMTAKAVLSGNYKLVSCQGCQERLRAPLDYPLVYCQGCGVVSPAGGGAVRRCSD